MSKARLVITAVVVEGRRPGEVAKTYGVSRSWVYELLARYRVEGEAAFEARSRRPKRSPRALPETTVELIIELRKDLPAKAWTPGRTPSPGTWSTTMGCGCRLRRWPATWPRGVL